MIALRYNLLFTSFLVGAVSATFANQNSPGALFRHLELQAAQISAAESMTAQRALQQVWEIDYTPETDPAFICSSYESDSGGAFRCECDLDPDNTVSLACEEVETKCNSDDSICYRQTVNVGLNADNAIDEVETCTTYLDLNLTRFEGSSTKVANYSEINPCVKVTPVAPGDFTSLTSCSVTINGDACHKCEICTTDNGGLGLSLDCCNTNPNGEPMKVECGAVGGGGAFVPVFDTYQESDTENCSSAGDIAGRGHGPVVGSLAVLAAIMGFAFF